jgi:hypothetical protein
VVIGTCGPTVVRLAYVVEPVVSLVATVIVFGIRSAIALTPVPTNSEPAVVARAGAVVRRSSRTEAFHWAAVSAVLETAVSGVDQAIRYSP